MKAKLLVVSVVCALSSAHAMAAVSCNGSYGFRVDVDGVVGETICADKAQTIIDVAKDLKSSNTSYTKISAAVGEGRFNGANFEISYEANSNKLVFKSDDIDVSESFEGSTRKESEDQFTDWFKHSDVMGKIMKYQAKTSASSPITGSGGLLPTLSQTDFATGFDGVSNIASVSTNTSSTTTDTNSDSSDGSSNKTQNSETKSSGSVNLIGVGVSVGSYKISETGERVTTTTLPLSYSINTNEADKRSQLILTVPITMYQVGSAKGYHAGLGVAHRFPITDKWTLTPGVRYALTGSVDRATVSAVYSGSLTSTYQIPVGKFDLAIGNMVGIYKTGKFKVSEYSFNPHVKQTMLRNGIMLSQPVDLKNQKLAVEYSLIDTRYVGGEKPFMKDMQELGITVGTHKDQVGRLSFLRGGVSFTRAKGSKGVTFNFGYWF